MPKDTRIWMTFPIDFWMHPKIAPLSDAAFRAFVEMNGYSRMQDLDGRIPVKSARKTWRSKALAELLANHPERPSLSVDGDVYAIWNYEEHQQTRAEREALSVKNTANGMKGGRPRKRNPLETQSVADQNPTETQPKAESESESESEKNLDINHLSQSSHEGDVAASQADFSEVVSMRAKRSGIHDLAAVCKLLTATCGPISAGGAVELVDAITARAQGRVRDVDAYVATACRNSPDDVRWDYERLDLAAAS